MSYFPQSWHYVSHINRTWIISLVGILLFEAGSQCAAPTVRAPRDQGLQVCATTPRTIHLFLSNISFNIFSYPRIAFWYLSSFMIFAKSLWQLLRCHLHWGHYSWPSLLSHTCPQIELVSWFWFIYWLNEALLWVISFKTNKWVTHALSHCVSEAPSVLRGECRAGRILAHKQSSISLGCGQALLWKKSLWIAS